MKISLKALKIVSVIVLLTGLIMTTISMSNLYNLMNNGLNHIISSNIPMNVLLLALYGHLAVYYVLLKTMIIAIRGK